MIGNSLLLLPGHHHFWEDFDRFIPHKDLSGFSAIDHALNLLFIPTIEPYYFLFIVLQLVCALLAICVIFPRLSAFSVWFFTVNLNNKIYITTDGGNNLMHLLLFYCIFIVGAQNETAGYFRRYLGATAYFVSRFQVCLVYFMAGLSKVTGEYWVSGMGLYYSLTVDEYTHPTLAQLIMTYPFISVIGSYITVLFQISFPFLIWAPRIRFIYFAFGSIIHIGISFGMGLLSFGLAMVVAYSVFYTDEQARTVLRFVGLLRWPVDRIKRMLRHPHAVGEKVSL